MTAANLTVLNLSIRRRRTNFKDKKADNTMKNSENSYDGLSYEELAALEELIAKLEADMPKKKTPLSKINFSDPVMRSVFVAMMPFSLPLVKKISR